MSVPNRYIALIIWGLLSANAQAAKSVVLAPEGQRITDRVVHADFKQLSDTQDRIAKLNNSGLAAENYFLVKTQAWLDFATAEYHENDRTGVTDAALFQAQDLLDRLERADKDIRMDTPVIPGSMRLREDLWRIAEAMKQHKGFVCAQAPVAEMEVRLVWAGHEQQELGWRHAREHFAAAERLAKQAQHLAENCFCPPPVTNCPAVVEQPPTQTVAPPVAVVPVETPPEPQVETPQPEVPAHQIRLVNVPRNVHFAVDKSDLNQKGKDVLRKVVAILKDHTQLTITLEGHTDNRASRDYNLRLSKRRVDTVYNELIRLGIDPARISRKAVGADQTISSEQDQLMNHALSRRVEVIYDGEKIESFDQRDDLMLESAAKKAMKAAKSAKSANKAKATRKRR